MYGTPVPGYAAPADTIGPATRVTRVLADLPIDVAATERAEPDQDLPEFAHAQPLAAIRASVAPGSTSTGGQVPTDLLVRRVMAWTYLFGAMSFELFGRRHNVIDEDRSDDFFAEETQRIANLLNLTER